MTAPVVRNSLIFTNQLLAELEGTDIRCIMSSDAAVQISGGVTAEECKQSFQQQSRRRLNVQV